MGFRKIKAGKIFDGQRYLPGHVLVINDNGIIEDLIPFEDAGDVESYNGILAPGLVNCHCHLELSHMKGKIGEGTGLVDFVFRIMEGRNAPAEEILNAISLAEDEMLLNGIVAVGDICNNTDTIAQKKKNRIHYYNFIEVSGWLPSVAAKRIQIAKELSGIFKRELNDSGPLLSVVPHAPYSVSDNLWQQLQPFFKSNTVTIHNQEAFCENDFFINATGDLTRMYRLLNMEISHHRSGYRSSLENYYERLNEASNIILVHNCFTNQADIELVRSVSEKKLVKAQTFFCLCPNANLYIEKTLPPVDLFRENKCEIVLGTDSLASNHSLDIMSEIRTIKKNFESVPLEEMLKWATWNGANALKMDRVLGSFEKGKRPGVVLIDEENLTAQRMLSV